jgi:hypothetical protein
MPDFPILLLPILYISSHAVLELVLELSLCWLNHIAVAFAALLEAFIEDRTRFYRTLQRQEERQNRRNRGNRDR